MDETKAAARGVIALLIGDRKAPSYFDFSLRGLIGSFIALLVAEIVSAYVPLILGARPEPGTITKLLTVVAILYAFQLGFSALVLRQLGRLDGLVPYLVADNWTNFVFTLVATLFVVFRLGTTGLFIIVIAIIVTRINNARLIVTLSPMQIAIFIIAQLVGGSLAFFVIGGIFPDMEIMPAGVATGA